MNPQPLVFTPASSPHVPISGSWALIFSSPIFSDHTQAYASSLLLGIRAPRYQTLNLLLFSGELQAIAAMAMTACVSSFQLDKAVQIFDGLRRSGMPVSRSVYNAVLDACAHATILCDPSTPLADLKINAVASLSGSGIYPLSLQGARTSLNSFSRETLAPFSRANWSRAIQLIVSAIGDEVVSYKQLVPGEKQSKGVSTLVLDASNMGLGLKITALLL
jgi:hypothetical protein